MTNPENSTTTVEYWKKRAEEWEAVENPTPMTEHEAGVARVIHRFLSFFGGTWSPQGWVPPEEPKAF